MWRSTILVFSGSFNAMNVIHSYCVGNSYWCLTSRRQEILLWIKSSGVFCSIEKKTNHIRYKFDVTKFVLEMFTREFANNIVRECFHCDNMHWYSFHSKYVETKARQNQIMSTMKWEPPNTKRCMRNLYSQFKSSAQRWRAVASWTFENKRNSMGRKRRKINKQWIPTTPTCLFVLFCLRFTRLLRAGYKFRYIHSNIHLEQHPMKSNHMIRTT